MQVIVRPKITATVTDTINPVITLLGDAELTFELAPAGTIFDEPKATATDGGDGDLTSSIVVTDQSIFYGRYLHINVFCDGYSW